jgi:hypothetical protein
MADDDNITSPTRLPWSTPVVTHTPMVQVIEPPEYIHLQAAPYIQRGWDAMRFLIGRLGVTEGYQSDQVIKALDRLRGQGHVLEDCTRADLRRMVMNELGWSSSQRQTIDRVLARHLGK